MATHQTELQQIEGFRTAILGANGLQALQSIAAQMIGHSEDITGLDGRAHLLDYCSEWQLDLMRREFAAR